MIIALDIETYEYSQQNDDWTPVLNARKFSLGCIKTETGKINFFYTPESMHQYIKDLSEKLHKNKKRLFIYGHNTEYDWYGIAKKELLNNDINYIMFNPFLAIYKEKTYICDTMSFYRMSLEKVGEILNFPKMKLPPKVKNMEELKAYLLRDVEITLSAILTLKEKLKKLGFNPRKLLTAGQVSMTSFLTYCRRNGLDKHFTEYNPELKIRQVIKTKYAKHIRYAFRGGINNAYQIGKFENVTQVDSIAHYGDAMETIDFPDLRTEQFIQTPTVGMLKKYMEKEIVVAQCIVKAPNISYGFLPVRFGGYQMFPTNRIIKGTWTHLELNKAIELGYEIIDCEWCIRWKKSEINPLGQFVRHLHDLEKECVTKEEKLPIKLLRNNLYGKFAQYKRNKDYKIIERWKINEYLKQGFRVACPQGNKYVMVKENEPYEPSYTNPIISTLISAKARLSLYEAIEKIPKEDMLYSDTDSCMFKGKHLKLFNTKNIPIKDYEHLTTEEIKLWKKTYTEMGEWKFERQGTTKILGEKRYYIENEVHISGLPKRYRTIDAIEKEENILSSRMTGLLQGIQKGNFDTVGTFNKFSIEMQPHAKNMVMLPRIVDETNIDIMKGR